MRSEERDDGMGVGGGDGGEKGGGMERAGIEEVGGFCGVNNISSRSKRYEKLGSDRDSGKLEYVLRPDLRVYVPKVRMFAERQD